MACDTDDAKRAASLVQEAKGKYEKASEDFKAARQISLDAQELQEQASRQFHSLPISHPETGAQVWTYRLSDGGAGPMSLTQLYGMAHDTALGVTLDTLICKAAHGESLLLREAVAKHPIIQQRYQTMVSAITAASAAAGVAREHRIARQAAAFERLQPQALLAWLAMGDEIWIQCKPEPQALSVRQIQDLVLAKFLSARLEFRAPTNGHTTQVADLIVLEYETLAARHLCSGSLVKQSGCWEQDSLPEPSNIQCWQRSSSSAGPQVLHSSAAILQLFQAGRWDIQQRLSHCSRPGESMSFAAVHAACDGLSKHLKDLLRNPVVIASSKAKAAQAELEECLARQVKQQLRDFVRTRCDEAVQQTQQRTAKAQASLLAPEADRAESVIMGANKGKAVPKQRSPPSPRSTVVSSQSLQEAKPAECPVVKSCLGEAVPETRSPTSPGSKLILADGKASAHTHLNGHAKAGLHLGERTEPAAAEEGTWLHEHADGHSTGVLACFSPDSEHMASQTGLPAHVLSAPADGRAETDRQANPAGEKNLPRLRGNPSCNEQYGSLPQSRQQLTGELSLGSTPPDRSDPDEHAGCSRRGLSQPGPVLTSNHEHRHAHGKEANQDQSLTRKQQHERSQHLNLRQHRDRRRGSSRDEHRRGSASPDPCEARGSHADPDQPYLGTRGTHDANYSDSGQRAGAAVNTPDQPADAAQLPKMRAPVTGASNTAEPLVPESCLPADSPQTVHPPADTASDTDGGGDVRDLLNSLVSAAEHDACAAVHTGLVRIGSASPAEEAMLASPLLSDAAEMRERTPAQSTLASASNHHAAYPTLAGDDGAIRVPTPAQADAGHAPSSVMLPEYGTGLEWDPDSLDTIPEAPMLLLDVPLGPRIFAAGMTRGEFLKQREEIGRIWKSQAPEGEQSNNREQQMDPASSQAGQNTCKQVIIINGTTGAIMQHSIPAPPQHSSAPDQHESKSRQDEPQAQQSSRDEVLLPEKPMSRRAARELGDLIEGLPETATSNRQRRQAVPFTADWHSSKPPPPKKRKPSETPEDGPLLHCHTAAPGKAAKAAVTAAKPASNGAVKTGKAAHGAAAARQRDKPRQEDAKGWNLSDRQARELGDLMDGQQWDCSMPRGRRLPGPGLPAGLPVSAAPVGKLKGRAAQRDSAGKTLTASKAGKAKKRQRDPGKAAEQDCLICSRMLPVDKVSRRSTATTRKARRAVQVDEEVAGTGRNVKRRVERNEEILNWRKLKGKEADLKLTRSKVHAWGLTAVKPIQAEQFVIEYTGELIRLSVNTMRERLDSDSDYRFRVDDQWVVDATTKGGLARFINHCCDPNCHTKIVNVDNAKHILIFSKRAISVGEELSYDYKFETTPGEAPIPCTCGAKSCRGRLN